MGTPIQAPLTYEIEDKLLEDRLDPQYYKPDYIETARVLSEIPFDVKTLGEISDSIRNFGAYALYNKIVYVESGVPFLREGNIKQDEIDSSDIKYISPEHHKLLQKSQVRPGSVLVTMTGNPGISAVVPESLGESNSNQHIAKVVLKKGINPRYITAFLDSKYGSSQIERMTTGTTHRHIFLYSISSIRIPVPPLEVQAIVAQTSQIAQEQVRQNRCRSIELFESIGQEVLAELGIEPPKTEPEDFMCVKDEDLDDRLDTEYYKHEYLSNMEALRKSKFETKTLRQISVDINRGVEPGSRAYKEDGIPFLRIQNILPYKIDFGETQFIGKELYKQLRGNHQVHPGEVLFSKDATIGISLVVPDNIGDCVISSGIARIKLKDDIDPLFVCSFLNTICARLQALRRSYGSIIRHLSIDELSEIEIPIPPKETQNRLAKEVRSKIAEADRLQEDTVRIEEDARLRICRIIEGKAGTRY